MRELNMLEIMQVSGGDQTHSDFETMSFSCFASWVYVGVSPLMGVAGVASATFAVITNCSDS